MCVFFLDMQWVVNTQRKVGTVTLKLLPLHWILEARKKKRSEESTFLKCLELGARFFYGVPQNDWPARLIFIYLFGNGLPQLALYQWRWGKGDFHQTVIKLPWHICEWIDIFRSAIHFLIRWFSHFGVFGLMCGVLPAMVVLSSHRTRLFIHSNVLVFHFLSCTRPSFCSQSKIIWRENEQSSERHFQCLCWGVLI